MQGDSIKCETFSNITEKLIILSIMKGPFFGAFVSKIMLISGLIFMSFLKEKSLPEKSHFQLWKIGIVR